MAMKEVLLFILPFYLLSTFYMFSWAFLPQTHDIFETILACIWIPFLNLVLSIFLKKSCHIREPQAYLLMLICLSETLNSFVVISGYIYGDGLKTDSTEQSEQYDSHHVASLVFGGISSFALAVFVTFRYEFYPRCDFNCVPTTLKWVSILIIVTMSSSLGIILQRSDALFGFLCTFGIPLLITMFTLTMHRKTHHSIDATNILRYRCVWAMSIITLVCSGPFYFIQFTGGDSFILKRHVVGLELLKGVLTPFILLVLDENLFKTLLRKPYVPLDIKGNPSSSYGSIIDGVSISSKGTYQPPPYDHNNQEENRKCVLGNDQESSTIVSNAHCAKEFPEECVENAPHVPTDYIDDIEKKAPHQDHRVSDYE